MPLTTAQKDELAANTTWCCEIWHMTSTSGLVAAYAEHTRPLVFDGATYDASSIEIRRLAQKIGLEPNTGDIIGVFDSIVTEADLDGGKWKKARIVRETLIDYRNLAMGSTTRQVGTAGGFEKKGDMYTVEFRSLVSLLNQTIGELTSPVDRHRRPEDLGINISSYTFAKAVTAVVDNRNFTMNGVAQANDYYQYGRIVWTSGANNGLQMEIKTNTGNVFELQLPMRSTVAIGDTANVIAGYNGTRDQCRDKFNAVINSNAEFDLPGPMGVLRYPQD